MSRHRWYIILGVCLVLTSTLFYLAHYAIFRDAHHIFIYMMGDLAFLPISVLLVSIIIENVINRREKTLIREKLNMVIGAFFSEVGTDLITRLSSFNPGGHIKTHPLGRDFLGLDSLSREDTILNTYGQPDSRSGDLEDLKTFLDGKRDFLLRLLENPNLLEHESFTELLRAVFHLAEELKYRPDLKNITGADYDHLTEDMTRAYTCLISRWARYINYLKDNYPYLFSLAERINPLTPVAGADFRATRDASILQGAGK